MAKAKTNARQYTYTVIQESKLDPEKSIIEKHGFIGAFRLCDTPGKIVEAEKQTKEVAAMLGQHKAVMSNVEQNYPALREYIKRCPKERLHALKIWGAAANELMKCEQDLRTANKIVDGLKVQEADARRQTGITPKK